MLCNSLLVVFCRIIFINNNILYYITMELKLIIDTSMDNKSMIKNAIKLIGRVVTISRGGRKLLYYYKGMLHSTPFVRIHGGCYLIHDSVDIDLTEIPSFKIFTTEIDIDESLFKTPQVYFQSQHGDKKVFNIGD